MLAILEIEAATGIFERKVGWFYILLGLSVFSPTVAGIKSCSKARAIFMMPKMPLVASLWPRFGFTAPRKRGSSDVRLPAKIAPIAATSRGSPAEVPVP